MTMGELIKYHRKRLHLSQEELGQMLKPKANKAAISKWEHGRVENIKRTHIQQMAKLFGLTPCELMCWDTDPVNIVQHNELMSELVEIAYGLNKEGQEEVVKYAHYVASQKQYESVKKESKNA